MTTGTRNGGRSPTLQNGATPQQIGPVLPGEWFFDPTARTKLHCVRNGHLLSDPNRLYIGLTGRVQVPSSAEGFGATAVGSVFVLSIGDPVDPLTYGIPKYLRTLVVKNAQNPTNAYQVSAIDVVPAREQYLGAGMGLQRNVVVLAGLETKFLNPPFSNPQDLLVFVQDR